MVDEKTELRNDIDKLKEDLTHLRSDIGSLTETLVGTGRDSAKAVRDQVQHRVESGIDSAKKCIEERPVTTMAAAFGVGLLLGKLFSSK